MYKTSLALAAAIAVTQCSGCCICRRLFRTATPAPAPIYTPAPTCCPTSPCGGCDSCSAPSLGYSDSGMSYPMEQSGVIYGNNTLPPAGPSY